MNRNHLKILVPGFLAAAALAFGAAAAGTPATPAPARMSKMDHAQHDAAMKTECKAMMAKHKVLEDKLQAMDVTVDKLLADVNAAKTSMSPDAMEKPMAALLNELVSQRKTTRALTAEMQAEMGAHQMHHMDKDGSMSGMECPMMKDEASAAKVSMMNPKP